MTAALILAHAGHWLAGLLYLAPVVIVVGALGYQSIKDRRRGDDGRRGRPDAGRAPELTPGVRRRATAGRAPAPPGSACRPATRRAGRPWRRRARRRPSARRPCPGAGCRRRPRSAASWARSPSRKRMRLVRPWRLTKRRALSWVSLAGSTEIASVGTSLPSWSSAPLICWAVSGQVSRQVEYMKVSITGWPRYSSSVATLPSWSCEREVDRRDAGRAQRAVEARAARVVAAAGEEDDAERGDEDERRREHHREAGADRHRPAGQAAASSPSSGWGAEPVSVASSRALGCLGRTLTLDLSLRLDGRRRGRDRRIWLCSGDRDLVDGLGRGLLGRRLGRREERGELVEALDLGPGELAERGLLAAGAGVLALGAALLVAALVLLVAPRGARPGGSRAPADRAWAGSPGRPSRAPARRSSRRPSPGRAPGRPRRTGASSSSSGARCARRGPAAWRRAGRRGAVRPSGSRGRSR